MVFVVVTDIYSFMLISVLITISNQDQPILKILAWKLSLKKSSILTVETEIYLSFP